MKKVLLIVGVFLLIIAIVIATIICTIILTSNLSTKTGNNIANIINENSNLPVNYLSTDKVDTTKLNCTVLNNYMSNDYRNDDIAFSYYGYPNDESDYHLGEISLLSNKYDLLGVRKGDNMSQSISKIEKYGFTLEDRNNDFVAELKNQDITITLEANIGDFSGDANKLKVEKIKIYAESKYLGNRIY